MTVQNFEKYVSESLDNVLIRNPGEAHLGSHVFLCKDCNAAGNQTSFAALNTIELFHRCRKDHISMIVSLIESRKIEFDLSVSEARKIIIDQDVALFVKHPIQCPKCNLWLPSEAIEETVAVCECSWKFCIFCPKLLCEHARPFGCLSEYEMNVLRAIMNDLHVRPFVQLCTVRRLYHYAMFFHCYQQVRNNPNYQLFTKYFDYFKSLKDSGNFILSLE
jgi:hypothetical protein